jgi:catechol 2,3-dioxygenase-like lactoylglutathione lyase family enzyme
MIKGIAHLAFQIADMERAVKFYETALGFKKKFILGDDHGRPWIVYLQVNARQFIELFYANAPLLKTAEKTSYQHLCIEVTDIRKLAEELARKGVPLAHPVILGLDHNWQCWIADPDGNQIELMEYGKDAMQLA